MKSKNEIIKDYFSAYNNFDVIKMTENFDINMVFENISEGQINIETRGVVHFVSQARQATAIFSKRHAKIVSTRNVNDHQVRVKLHYTGILKGDFDGIPAGEEIKIGGESVFTFQNGKVVKLQDIS